MTFFKDFTNEIIISGVVLIVLMVLRVISTKVVHRYAKTSHKIEYRTNLVIKYLHLLINILSFIALVIIWGVKVNDIFLVVSSTVTIIGVAMVAQWSILSNITAGVILFFSFPFKIGDSIKIHDKDFPIIGEIEDIGAFHVVIKTIEGEEVIYPNNLLFQKGISILHNYHEEKEFTD
ncbi:mechanosensitive ion channel domain-containing protein [Flavobacterium seoulense]|uniref:Small mechanosensitive ion channel protein MscS n=1 Tax=Flavobacterium seoulense TaxID=1492738 RepID=A0A066WKQ4_9FLAO|nr:mechanosensitive ion channel domain-containing protein [Flavobacterium seoulense]KDN54597.1 small mechanosensitive ion channel protein MscS [Flavobacterium seoulense]